MNSFFFSLNYVFYIIPFLDKKYGINFNERETLQHYVTLSHINIIKYVLFNPHITTYYLS